MVITFKDRFLLIELAKYKILSNKTIDIIYGSKQYPRRRRKKLHDDGYIIKNNKYCRIGPNGVKYLESIDVPIKGPKKAYDKFTIKRLIKISDAFIPWENKYRIYPSWELKRHSENVGERKEKYYGKIVSKFTNKQYYVYNLGKLSDTKFVSSVRKKEYYINYIQSEILRKEKEFDSVILLVEDKATMKVFTSMEKSLFLKEQLLVPFNASGLKLIDFIASNDPDKAAISSLFGNGVFENSIVKEPSKCFYYYFDKKICCLLTNDIEKIINLKRYLDTSAFNLSKKEQITIVCLRSQFLRFKNELSEYKNIIEILYVPDSIINT